jgi:carbonic anhydrase/acetyltransferase-like protein (isoleucine patch superfamily)
MGSIIMDNAVIEEDTIIGAGSLVPSNKVLQRGFLWMGSPARQIRPLTKDEKASILYSAQHYVRLKNQHLETI